jgi:hypothetical protein
MSTQPASTNLIRPVRILSEMPAPPMTPLNVHLHYFQDGEYRRALVPTMRPIFYGKVVVSSLRETLPAVTFARPPANSLKNVARGAFFAARKRLQSFAGPVSFTQPVLDLREIEPNTFAHLLTDILPRFLLARSIVGPNLKLLLRRQPVGSFAELFAFLGITPTVEIRAVTADVVRIRGMRGLSLHELFDGFDCWGLHFNPEVFCAMNFPSPHNFERIFLARRSPRDLINQAEIEAITARFGYKMRYMEDYPVGEQLGIGAKAKHVIAVHGAAMSLLAGNPQIDSVVELFPPNVQHEFYPALFGSKVAKYHQIVPSYDPRVAQSGWDAVYSFKNRNFAMDAALLERILTEVHSSEN